MAQQTEVCVRKIFIDIVYHPETKPKDIYNLYEQYGTHYDKFLANEFPGQHAVAECFSKIIINRNSKILDCGAGTGLVGEELRRLGYDNVDAIDMSETCLKIAHEKGVYKNIMCAKLSGEPIEGIKKDAYDAIITCGCFVPGHLDDSVLNEWTRIVKKNGLICGLVNGQFIELLEGKTYRKLVDEGKIEVVNKYKIEDYIFSGSAYFYGLRVLC